MKIIKELNNDFLIVFPKNRTDFSSKFIKFFTGGKSSHVEFLIKNNLTITTDIENGVHYSQLDHYYKNNVELDLFEFTFDIPLHIQIILLRYIESFIGKKYDELGTIKSVFSWFFQNKNEYFCSELVLKIIKKVFELMKIDEFSNIKASNTNPAELKKMIRNSKYFIEVKNENL